QDSLANAAQEIKRVLDGTMGVTNQAYGRLCGYDNGVPRCYRIDREPGQNASQVSGPIDLLRHIVSVGSHHLAAESHVKQLLSSGSDERCALIAGIEAQYGKQ